MAKRFPIGIQDFEKLRKSGFCYVDKTALVYEIANGSQYNFLSRPR
ncbi:MAG: AAA family ATPase, partial [bacterium]|nr:AAA family ATPase [bacterium]MDD6868437.1 AAA family ATPase [bacterium]